MEKEKNLTKEQLSSIYNYLIENRVRYVDVIFETLDHIACDIEMQMNLENISFEKAFDVSKKKWKTSLKPSNSFWIGVINTRPKIEVDTCVKIVKPIFKKVFLFLLLVQLPAFLLDVKSFELGFSTKWLNYFFTFISVLGSVTISYVFIKIIQSKIKTSFSFIFHTQVVPLIVFNIFVNFIYFNFYKNPEKIDALLILTALMNVFYVFTAIKLYGQHKQTLTRYKLI